LTPHGGNFKTLARIVENQAKKYKDVKIVGGFALPEMAGLIKELEKNDGLPLGTCGGHACAFETSEMLLFAPQYVDMDKAECGLLGDVTDDLLQKFFTDGILAISENGILGDARPSSAERGARFFKALQDRLEQVVRDNLARS
jgi:creatinine amidohydrolase